MPSATGTPECPSQPCPDSTGNGRLVKGSGSTKNGNNTSPPTACASTGLSYTSGPLVQELYNALSSPVNCGNVAGGDHGNGASGGESQSTTIDHLMEDYSEEVRLEMQARVDNSQK